MHSSPIQYLAITCLALLLLLSGCASVPEAKLSTEPALANTLATPGTSTRHLAIARTMLGRPYRYGGANPRGFDCSGLVYYAFSQSGTHVPRTAHQQFQSSRRISTNKLKPGDLLFFNTGSQRISHVAIYAGDQQFVHAPSSGKMVRMGALNNPYWENRLVAAGRF